MDLNTIWFILIGVLLAGYAVLDGFDLGVGALHLFTDNDLDRRIMINSIGPVWDGNEVWLVTGGGALFAAFPEVYATAFSGFYIALMLLLVMLIFRAVAIEFRSKRPDPGWRKMWDISFAVSSIVSSILIGVALGNIAMGIPLDADYEFAGSFLGLLRPYPILVGLTTVALFMMHGNIYVVMKTEGDLQEKARGWIKYTIGLFMSLYLIVTVWTLIGGEDLKHMTDTIYANPWLFVVPAITLLAILNVPRELHHGREGRAFIFSCVSVVGLLALFGIGMFPNLIYSWPNPEHSLNIINAASSQKTLTIMGIIALIGMPIVIAYTISIYWVFRGKVVLDEMSY